MKIGKMRRKVMLRATQRTPDGGGGWTETPTNVAKVWARVEGLEGRELIQAMQTEMQRPYRFTMRYREGVSGANTILYDGRTFDIKSVVDPDERRRELHILADEVT